ncbi:MULTISPECIES: hypothetical protein [unclassified Nocardia]|uniref:hypothetical protein n=1 Tax=unclassified Nocardia TaxID=2637762 RepID=UPI00278C7360|nr:MULTISPECIES: hypothetical protein [unclassified Nocardia]
MSRIVAATAALALALGAALLGSTAKAAAAVPFPAVVTLASAGTCAGEISAVALPGNGVAAIYLRGTFMTPVPQPACVATTTIAWRNLDSGTSGTAGADVTGSPGGRPGPITGAVLPTGPGRVEAWVSTVPLPHLPSMVSFTVG